MKHSDDGPIYIPGPNAHGAMANELARAVEEPAYHEQTQQSTDLTTRGIPTPMQDVMPFPSAANGKIGSGIFTLPSSITGIALTGFLGPGDFCLLGPASIIQDLALRYSVDNASPSTSYVGLINWLLSSIGNTNFNGSPTLPAGCFLLRPGESVDFGRILGDGLVGMFLNDGPREFNVENNPGFGEALWPVPYPANTGIVPTGAPVPPPFVNDGSIVGPSSRPLLRVFRENQSVPRTVAYTKVPWSDYKLLSQTNNTTLPNGQSNAWYPTNSIFTYVSGGVPTILPTSTDWVTIALNAKNLTTLPASTYAFGSLADSGIANFNLNVFWLLSDGIWHTNPGDQWTAAARGQAGANHDVEVYETPKNALGVALKIDSTFIVPANWAIFSMFIATEN